MKFITRLNGMMIVETETECGDVYQSNMTLVFDDKSMSNVTYSAEYIALSNDTSKTDQLEKFIKAVKNHFSKYSFNLISLFKIEDIYNPQTVK